MTLSDRRRMTLKQATPHFCREGQQWARRQPNLRKAWATCKNGHWMAWWLVHYRGVNIVHIHAIGSAVGAELFPMGCASKDEQRRLATALRAQYLPSGRLRHAR